jgi:hypothetical protein
MAEDVSCRLTVAPMYEADPPALRVTQIAWDSGFRGSQLRVGDQIVAVNGAAVERPADAQALARASQNAIGSLGEARSWAEAGLAEGSAVTLKLRRRQLPGVGWQSLEVSGTLQPQRSWRNEQNQPVFGPGGPQAMYEYDGFNSSWSQWYEQEVLAEFAKVLDDPLYALSQTTRYLLEQNQARRGRVDLLVAQYPGPFAAAVKSDYDAVMARLLGEAIAMPAGAMDFRRQEAEQAAEVGRNAVAAWEAAQAANAANMIVPFPAIDPSRQDRSAVVGKLVLLGPLRNQDWISDAGRSWFVAGNDSQGFYFADAESPQAEAMQRAMLRYRRLVAPDIAASFEFIAQILDAPRLGVVNGRAHFGLQVQLLAALVGRAMFVDLSPADSSTVSFAGEAAFAQPQGAMPAPDAAPAEVMRVFVTAVKEGDLALWKQLFSAWRVEYTADRRPLLFPQPIRVSESRFEDARRLILGKVADVRPVWTGDPRVIVDGSAWPGALAIEEVDVQMQHIGEFNGEYRAFSDVTVTDFWKLQRVNGGPWRIAGDNVL